MENIASLFVGNFSGESTSSSTSDPEGLRTISSGTLSGETPSTTSRLSVDMAEYVTGLRVREKRIKKSTGRGVGERGDLGDFSIRDLSEAFAYVEGSAGNAGNVIVSYVLMNAKTFSIIRRWGNTIYDESSYRDIMNYGIFGHIWTANILVNSQIKDNVIYLVSTCVNSVLSFNSGNTCVFKVKFVNEKEKEIKTNVVIPDIGRDDVLIVKVGTEERPASSEDVEEIRSAIDHVVHSRGKFKAIVSHHCINFVVLKKSALDNSLVGAALQNV